MDKATRTLHDVLSLGISHLEFIRKQIMDMKMTAEDEHHEERMKQFNLFVNAASVVNDILHPAYPMIKELFDDEKIHSLVEYYKFLHSKHPARSTDFKCPCIACENANTSPHTDQTEQV